MVAYIFQKIAQNNTVDNQGLSAGRDTSRRWFGEEVKNLRQSQPKKSNPVFTSRMDYSSIGSMYLFSYDPKTKKTLPYYDTYPLVFPIKMYGDGFLGLNLHYISPLMRAKLMNELYSTLTNKKNDQSTRIRVSYELLNATSRFRYFKPCVKRYLFTHVKSRFMYISPDDWDKTIMMPTESFVGATKARVYAESAKRF